MAKIAFKEWSDLVLGSIAALAGYIAGFEVEEVGSPHESMKFRQLCRELRESILTESKIDSEVEEGAREAAAFLVFSIVPSHLGCCYLTLTRALSYEASIMLRATIEALDLVEFFFSDQCTSSQVLKWHKGRLVMPRDTRARTTRFAFLGGEFEERMNESQQQEWNATFGVHSTFVHELRKLQYKAYSLYVHHGSAAVALNIDDPALRSETLGHLFIDFNNQIARALRYTLWHFGAFLPPGVATDVEEMVKKLKAFTALEKAVVHDFVLCHLNQRVY